MNTATAEKTDLIFISNNSKFFKIPSYPITYWVSETKANNFKNLIDRVLDCKTGLICGNNEKYIRFWFEVKMESICFSCQSINQTSCISSKWFPYNHGGQKTKWYGGHLELINMYHDAIQIRQEKNAMLRNSDYYFQKGITWNRVGSGVKFAARMACLGFVFDDVSPSGFVNDEEIENVLGYMNSVVFNDYLRMFSNGLKVEIGQILKVPYKPALDLRIKQFVNENIQESKVDWDSFETSWDFKKHPLV